MSIMSMSSAAIKVYNILYEREIGRKREKGGRMDTGQAVLSW